MASRIQSRESAINQIRNFAGFRGQPQFSQVAQCYKVLADCSDQSEELQFNANDFKKVCKDGEQLLKSDYLQKMYVPNPELYALLCRYASQAVKAVQNPLPVSYPYSIQNNFIQVLDPQTDETLRLLLRIIIERNLPPEFQQQLLVRLRPNLFKKEYEREVVPLVQILPFQIMCAQQKADRGRLISILEGIVDCIQRNVMRSMFSSAIARLYQIDGIKEQLSFVQKKVSTFMGWLSKPKHAASSYQILVEIMIENKQFIFTKDFEKLKNSLYQQPLKGLYPLVRLISQLCFNNNILDQIPKVTSQQPQNLSLLQIFFDFIEQFQVIQNQQMDSINDHLYLFIKEDSRLKDSRLSYEQPWYNRLIYLDILPFFLMNENVSFCVEIFGAVRLLVMQNPQYFISNLDTMKQEQGKLLLVAALLSIKDDCFGLLSVKYSQQISQAFSSLATRDIVCIYSFSRKFNSDFVKLLLDSRCILPFNNFDSNLFGLFLNYLNSFDEKQMIIGFSLYKIIITQGQKMLMKQRNTNENEFFKPQMFRDIVKNLLDKSNSILQFRDSAIHIIEQLVVDLLSNNYQLEVGQQIQEIIIQIIRGFDCKIPNSAILKICAQTNKSIVAILVELVKHDENFVNIFSSSIQSSNQTDLRAFYFSNRNILWSLFESGRLNNYGLQHFCRMFSVLYDNLYSINSQELDFLESLQTHYDLQSVKPCLSDYQVAKLGILAKQLFQNKLNLDKIQQEVLHSEPVSQLFEFMIKNQLVQGQVQLSFKNCLNIGFVVLLGNIALRKYRDTLKLFGSNTFEEMKHLINDDFYVVLSNQAFAMLVYILSVTTVNKQTAQVLQFVFCYVVRIINEVPSIFVEFKKLFVKIAKQNFQSKKPWLFSETEQSYEKYSSNLTILFESHNEVTRLLFVVSYLSSHDFKNKSQELQNVFQIGQYVQHIIFSKTQLSVFILQGIFNHNMAILSNVSQFNLVYLQNILNISEDVNMIVDLDEILLNTFSLYADYYQKSFEKTIQIQVLFGLITTKFCEIQQKNQQFLIDILTIYLCNIKQFNSFCDYLKNIIENEQFFNESLNFQQRQDFGMSYDKIQFDQSVKQHDQKQIQESQFQISYLIKILLTRALAECITSDESKLQCLSSTDQSVYVNCNRLFNIQSDCEVEKHVLLQDVYLLFKFGCQFTNISPNLQYFAYLLNRNHFGSRIRLAFQQKVTDDTACGYFYITALIMFCVILHTSSHFRQFSSQILSKLHLCKSVPDLWKKDIQQSNFQYNALISSKSISSGCLQSPLFIPGFLWFLKGLQKNEFLFNTYQDFIYQLVDQYISYYFVLRSIKIMFTSGQEQQLKKVSKITKQELPNDDFLENTISESNSGFESTNNNEYQDQDVSDLMFKNHRFGDLFIHAYLKFLTNINQYHDVTKFTVLFQHYVENGDNQSLDRVKRLVVRLVQFYTSNVTFQRKYEIEQYSDKQRPKMIKVQQVKTRKREPSSTQRTSNLVQKSELSTSHTRKQSKETVIETQILNAPFDEFWQCDFDVSIIHKIISAISSECFFQSVSDTLNLFHSPASLSHNIQINALHLQQKSLEFPYGLAVRDIQSQILRPFMENYGITSTNCGPIAETLSFLVTDGLYVNLLQRIESQEEDSLQEKSVSKRLLSQQQSSRDMSILESFDLQQSEMVQQVEVLQLKEFHFLLAIYDQKTTLTQFLDKLLNNYQKSYQVKGTPPFADFITKIMLCLVSNTIIHSSKVVQYDYPPWFNSDKILCEQSNDSLVSDDPNVEIPLLLNDHYNQILNQKLTLIDFQESIIIFLINGIIKEQNENKKLINNIVTSAQIYQIFKYLVLSLLNASYQYQNVSIEQNLLLLQKVTNLILFALYLQQVTLQRSKTVENLKFFKLTEVLLEKVMPVFIQNQVLQKFVLKIVGSFVFPFMTEYSIFSKLFNHLNFKNITSLNSLPFVISNSLPNSIQCSIEVSQTLQIWFDNEQRKSEDKLLSIFKSVQVQKQVNYKEKQAYFVQHVQQLLSSAKLDSYISVAQLQKQQYNQHSQLMHQLIQSQKNFSAYELFVLNVLNIVQIMQYRAFQPNYVLKELILANKSIIVKTIDSNNLLGYLVNIYNILVKQDSSYDKSIVITLEQLIQDTVISDEMFQILVPYATHTSCYQVSALIILFNTVVKSKTRSQLKHQFPVLANLRQGDWSPAIQPLVIRLNDLLGLQKQDKQVCLELSIDQISKSLMQVLDQ